MLEIYKKFLNQVLKFKSVSASSSSGEEIKKTVDWYMDVFSEPNWKKEVIEGYENPVILASYEVSKDLPTCLIYGHYDVQPAELSDGWESDPFTLTEKDLAFFGRGTSDNKGQSLIHIVAIKELIKEGALKYNVKFLLEGNEETGSGKLRNLLEERLEKFKSDFVLISDGELAGKNPTIELGFRGVFNAELIVKTSDRDLHSGIYGGVAPNSGEILVGLLSKIRNANKNEIPDFNNGVKTITDEEREFHRIIDFQLASFKSITGTKAILAEEDFFTQTGLLPSIEITGIKSGYIGEGFRNSIPASSSAKLNIRTTPDQNPEEVFQAIDKFISSNIPEYADYEFRLAEFARGVRIDKNNEFAKKAKDILENVYGENVVFRYVGGTLPIVKDIQDVLKVPQLMIPLANDDCGMHSARENFKIEFVKKGLAFSAQFFS